MKFLVKKQLTGIRIPKDDFGSVRTTPTEGGMRISGRGAELLRVTDGDYLDLIVLSATDDEGNPAVDASGKEIEVFAIRKGYKTEEETCGAKLASQNDKVGGTLNFSSSSAYNALGGGNGFNMIYKINPEPFELEENDKVFYAHEITLVDKEVPTPRKARTSSEDEVEVQKENEIQSENEAEVLGF